MIDLHVRNQQTFSYPTVLTLRQLFLAIFSLFMYRIGCLGLLLMKLKQFVHDDITLTFILMCVNVGYKLFITQCQGIICRDANS